MANWNDIENMTLPGFLMFLSLAILIPGSIAIYLSYQIFPFWEGTALCRLKLPGVVQHRQLEPSPESGLPALSVEVLYYSSSERYICSEWSPGRRYLEEPIINDPRFYENGLEVYIWYDPGQPDRSILRRYPPNDILLLTLITLIFAIPGLLLPIISGSKYWRNANLFGSAGAGFVLIWTWALVGASTFYLPTIAQRLGL